PDSCSYSLYLLRPRRRRHRHTTRPFRKRLPRRRPLHRHSGLAPIAHAAREHLAQSRPLLIAECRLVVATLQRLQLTLEHVFRKRPASYLSRRREVPQHRIGIALGPVRYLDRVVVADVTEVERFRRLVLHDLLFQR